MKIYLFDISDTNVLDCSKHIQDRFRLDMMGSVLIRLHNLNRAIATNGMQLNVDRDHRLMILVLEHNLSVDHHHHRHHRMLYFLPRIALCRIVSHDTMFRFVLLSAFWSMHKTIVMDGVDVVPIVLGSDLMLLMWLLLFSLID